MIKHYLSLIKPGIVVGNSIVAAAGFIFGSSTPLSWPAFFLMLFGLSCIIASACVFNNIFDKDIDAKMERTKGRALPAGAVSFVNAFVVGVVLVALGSQTLLLINFLALGTALLGFAVYVFLYTPLKHKSAFALFVGAVAGAMPPVVGYTAAGNSLDWYALVLFLFLFVWQIPHFLAIARYRFDEYRAAGVPLFVRKPATKSGSMRAQMIFRGSLIVLLVFCAAISAVHFF